MSSLDIRFGVSVSSLAVSSLAVISDGESSLGIWFELADPPPLGGGQNRELSGITM